MIMDEKPRMSHDGQTGIPHMEPVMESRESDLIIWLHIWYYSMVCGSETYPSCQS